MPALMYGEIMAGLLFDQMTGGSGGGYVWTRRLFFAGLVILALAGFIWYSPWVYAFGKLTREEGMCVRCVCVYLRVCLSIDKGVSLLCM